MLLHLFWLDLGVMGIALVGNCCRYGASSRLASGSYSPGSARRSCPSKTPLSTDPDRHSQPASPPKGAIQLMLLGDAEPYDGSSDGLVARSIEAVGAQPSFTVSMETWIAREVIELTPTFNPDAAVGLPAPTKFIGGHVGSTAGPSDRKASNEGRVSVPVSRRFPARLPRTARILQATFGRTQCAAGHR